MFKELPAAKPADRSKEIAHYEEKYGFSSADFESDEAKRSQVLIEDAVGWDSCLEFREMDIECARQDNFQISFSRIRAPKSEVAPTPAMQLGYAA